MIKNKIIEITKNNTFNKSWALFTKSDINYASKEKGLLIKEIENYITIKEIENYITFASQIDLIVSFDILHKRIFDAILWAFMQGGLVINLVYKSDKLLKGLKDLSFNKTIKDNDLTLNYICIQGKRNNQNYEVAFLLEDDIVQLDSPIDFNSSNKNSYNFLDDCNEVFIIDELYSNKYDEFILNCKKRKIGVNYIIETKNFSKNIHDLCREKQMNLFVCENIKPAILLANKNTNKLSCFKFYKNINIFFDVYNSNTYIINTLYKNNFKEICMKDLPTLFLSYNSGEIKQCKINEYKEIDITVQNSTMEDFINEDFDKSIVDRHNDYSDESKSVKYIFNLIPPRLNDSYKISSIYNGINNVSKDIEALNDKVVLDFGSGAKSIIAENWISKMCDAILKDKKEILNLIDKYQFMNFSEFCDNIICNLQKNKSIMIEEVIKIYSELNQDASDIKFTKIDDEIQNYRQTIQEKEKLVLNNIDVLSNKRRIEILEKKINDLELLKQRFSCNSNDRNKKNTDEFKASYIKWIKSQNIVIPQQDSVKSVINTKGLSNIELFEMLVKNYLYDFNNYLENFLKLIKELKNNIVFPLKYLVYEKDNKNYIALTDISEYESSKEIRKKFNLFAIAKE